jgi:hypothetical protein
MGGTVFINGVDAQVVFQGKSNLPTDRYVNTFHFSGGARFTETELDGVAAALEDFYNGDHPSASGNRLRDFLSPVISTAVTIKLYHRGDPEPREPVEYSFDITVTGDPLPSEVALCLSYFGAGRNIVGQRGRIYLGPLDTSAVTTATGSSARPVPSLVDTLAAAGADLASSSEPGANWVVYSPTDGVVYTIDGGWVDNAFDTQRRRGAVPTARTTFDVS